MVGEDYEGHCDFSDEATTRHVVDVRFVNECAMLAGWGCYDNFEGRLVARQHHVRISADSCGVFTWPVLCMLHAYIAVRRTFLKCAACWISVDGRLIID